jgi:hypothetical protein
MKKLKLEIDRVQVVSFAVEAAAPGDAAERGSTEAGHDTGQRSCANTCGTCAIDCFGFDLPDESAVPPRPEPHPSGQLSCDRTCGTCGYDCFV